MHYRLNIQEFPHVSHMNLHNTVPDWIHFRRISGEYILFIIKSGSLYIKENTTEYELKTGDMLLLDPEKLHIGSRPAQASYYYIHFPATVLSPVNYVKDELFTILSENRNLFYNTSPFEHGLYWKSPLILPKTLHMQDSSLFRRIELFMEQAIFASEHHHDHFKITLSCCFMEILVELASFYSTTVLDIENACFSKQQLAFIQNIIEYLHTHYTEKISSTSISEHFQMNFDYLNRIFKKKNGITIFSYLNTLRINKATELLVAGNLKSYEIADAVGFHDTYYFSKAFKKQMGTSPKNYLKIHS